MRRYELHRTAITVLALLVLGGAGVGPSTAAAQTIDDFNVAQAELALVAAANNVGDTAASSAAAGLGGERGLLLRLLEKGAGGTVSAEVDAGQLSLSADAGMRGELLLSWDGSDGDPAVLDTAAGLGGVDLTAGGADTGLELLVAAASAAGIEVEIEVHSSPEEASRAALVLPAVAAQASFVVSFENDFVATGSAGAADFSAATAVVLRLRTRGSTLQIDALTAVPPRLLQADATKTDTLIDGDGDGLADPGETVRYTITITNTGAAAAAVTLDDVIDANAELVPGSIAISPVAQRDTYSAVGNVALVVAAPGVLANDSDPDGGAVAVDSASLSLTTAQGGAVELAVDGGFTYTPPTGFTGVDSFDYAIVDGDTPERTATGTAAVVVEGRVWFVDNSHAGPFAGTQADPFETLAQVQAASLPGDVIRVRLGDDTYGGGLQLTAGQQLVGGGVDLVLGGQTIEAAGGAPTLANAGGHVIALADDVVVAGVTLTSTAGAALAGNGSGGNVLVDTVDIRPSASGGGLDLAGQTGSFTFASSSIASPAMTTTTGTALRIAGGSADLDFTQGSSLALAGGRLLDVSGFAGTLDLRGTAPTLAAGSGTAITLVGNAGAIFTFDIIGDIGVAAGGGGLVVSSSGTVNLDSVGTVSVTGGPALAITGTTVATSGGPVAVAALSSTSSSSDGIVLDGVAPGVAVSGTTTVDAAAGNAVSITTSGAVTFTGTLTASAARGLVVAANNGTVTATDAANGVSATAGPALDLASSAVNLSFATLSSALSPTNGVRLDTVTGTVAAAGGSITGAAGNAFDVNGGAAAVGYGGAITNTANRAVEITNLAGGSVTLSGAVTDTGAAGILLDNNDLGGPAVVTFSGTVDITGSTGVAVTLSNTGQGATSFADLDIDNAATNQVGLFATANTGATLNTTTGTIDSGSATAVDIDTTTLGMTLESVRSIGGSAVGIDLSQTAGSFTVAGRAPAGPDCQSSTAGCTGGAIGFKSGRGIRLDRTSNVSLTRLRVHDTGDDGLYGGGTAAGEKLSGLAIRHCRFEANGNAVDEHGIELRDLFGSAVIADTLVTDSAEDAVRIFNDSGVLADLDVTGSTFSLNSPALGNNGLNIEAGGAARMTDIDISGCTFDALGATAVQVNATDSAVVDASVVGSTFTDNNIAVNLTAAAQSDLTFEVLDNPAITGHASHAVNVFSGATSEATITGTIRNNTIGTDGVAGSGSAIGNGIRLNLNGDATARLTVDGNAVHGIQFGRGIEAICRLGAGSCSMALTDNQVRVDPANGLAGIYLETRDANTLCARVAGNDTVGGPFFPPGFGGAYLLQQTGGTFNLEGTAADAAAEIATTNTGLPVNATGTVNIVAPGFCAVP